MSPRQKRTKRSLPNGDIKHGTTMQPPTPFKKIIVGHLNEKFTGNLQMFLEGESFEIVFVFSSQAEVSDHHEIVKTGDDDCHLQLRVSHEPP